MATTIILKHHGKVVKGKKVYYRQDLIDYCLKELEGKEFEEVLKEKTKHVSTNAFGFYFKGIIGTALQAEMFGGWEKEELHEYFAKQFLSYTDHEKYIGQNGETVIKEVTKVRSLSALNSKEMSEYCNKVIAWLAYHKIVILNPENYDIRK